MLFNTPRLICACAIVLSAHAQKPSSADLFDIRGGITITASSPASDPSAMFGAGIDPQESSQTLFADNHPNGTIHFVEWHTRTPVLLDLIRVFSAGDTAIYLHEREFDRFVLKAKSSPSGTAYDRILYSFSATHPYDFVDSTNYLAVEAAIAPVEAQYFRAEFVQWNAGRNLDGPRVIELDGFGQTVTEARDTIADWTFEDGTPGASFLTAKDTSGNGHDGNALGAPPGPSASGEPRFVQSSAQAEGNVSVSFPAVSGGIGYGFKPADSQDFFPTNEFTVEVSVTPGESNTGWNRGIVVGQDAQTGRLVYALDYRSETRFVNFSTLSVSGEAATVSARLPNDNAPHHVAGVYSNEFLLIFVDKLLVEVKSTSLGRGVTRGGAGRVTVGANDIGGFWFEGVLDRVRLSRKALVPAEFFSRSPTPGKKILPSNTDLFDVRNGAALTGNSAVLGGFSPLAALGFDQGSAQSREVIFADRLPNGYTHFIEWRTATPILLEAIRVFGAGDTAIYLHEREFGRFVLKTKSANSTTFDKVLYSFDATHPYTVVEPGTEVVVDAPTVPTVGQFFRAEFIQWDAGRGLDGPRVIEIDGFGTVQIPSLPATVADWTFEEGTAGTVVQTVRDASTNAHNGLVLGQPSFVRSSAPALGDVSISFPAGTGGFGSGFKPGDSIDFALRNEFTLEASVLPGENNSAWNRGIIVGQNAQSGRLAYALDYRSETRVASFSIHTAEAEYAVVSAVIPNDQRPHHIGAVYSNEVLRIYLDRNLVESKTSPLAIHFGPTDTGRLTVGANDIGGFWFEGVLDRVRISRKALAVEEFFESVALPLKFPPFITLQPESLELAEGASARLSVAATSTLPMQFQWSWNGAPLFGATTPVLVLNNLQIADAGTYAVAVSNSDGIALSSGAVLNVTNSLPGGTLNFNNGVAGFVNAPITNQLGIRAAGVEYLAQLYAGTSLGSLKPLGAAVPLGTGDRAGFFAGGTRTVPGIDPGSPAVVQVRAWSSTTATTYEQAVARGGPHGSAAIIPVLLGGGGSPAALLTGLTGFSLASVPEISQQPTGGSLIVGSPFQLRLSVATAGPVTFQWFLDGAPIAGATNTTYSIGAAALTDAGAYTVEARNSAGAVLSRPALVHVKLPRTVFLPPLAPVQEGSRLSFPVLIRSAADISAITLQLSYSSIYFSEPEFAWAAEPIGVLAQVNTNTAGEIRGSFALPGVTLPGGTNVLASVSLRVKSIPQTLTAPLGIEVLGVYGVDGSPLVGTVATSGSVRLLQRKFLGDNNANDRLDVGDASAMLRFVTLLDPLRQWDAAANDLNKNGQLDAGDIIRVLRAVVELDPQPGATNGVTALSSTDSADVRLTADNSRLALGDKLKVRVQLDGRSKPVSGASFRLSFPTNALWIDNASAIQTGSLVLPGAVTLWNLAPAQNIFDAQNGVLLFAVSSASPWASNQGDLLDLTFSVRSTFTNQQSWSIGVSSIDLAEGSLVTAARDSELVVTSRESMPANISFVTRESNGSIRFSVTGDIGTIHRIETSDDLVTWSVLRSELNTTGSIPVVDDTASDAARRFYRVVY